MEKSTRKIDDVTVKRVRLGFNSVWANLALWYYALQKEVLAREAGRQEGSPENIEVREEVSLL